MRTSRRSILGGILATPLAALFKRKPIEVSTTPFEPNPPLATIPFEVSETMPLAIDPRLIHCSGSLGGHPYHVNAQCVGDIKMGTLLATDGHGRVKPAHPGDRVVGMSTTPTVLDDEGNRRVEVGLSDE